MAWLYQLADDEDGRRLVKPSHLDRPALFSCSGQCLAAEISCWNMSVGSLLWLVHSVTWF